MTGRVLLNLEELFQLVQEQITQGVRDSFIAQYRSEIAAGNKVVSLAHSQGNFYANEVYRVLYEGEQPLETRSVGVVGVATPASEVGGDGPYTTLERDIILLVRKFEPAQLPANIAAGECAGEGELLVRCHAFVESYLGFEATRGKILEDLLTVAAGLELPPGPSGGRIVVNNDEWTLSDVGFASAPDTGRFALNVAAFLTGGAPARIHAYSNNFSYTGAALAATLSGAGYTYTTGTAFPFTLENISGYEALFLGEDYLTLSEIATLIAYVNGGGSVYLVGGTGIGGPDAEAAAWNPFLNVFGLAFESPYNNVVGNVAVSGHAIFDGVSALYQDNGNPISGTGVVCCAGLGGLFAVAVPSDTINIPVTNNPSRGPVS